ncbi:uncharacterized protein C8Q71DRAFT_863289 [Rhodofomes roseus]|uniref:F-box domain-containing protein n=1 Tax=Rhodofomes roseus TaxID=34475 RepID=A0ABQ8JZ69_9APHY|nr:uncharacterized protein C8Q71DRAFT_863289 [Rhodofomes roseus]KAH9829361.1 hypothetical protein C8Q71DRAFT_863289 [Rhodofomes roseus]
MQSDVLNEDIWAMILNFTRLDGARKQSLVTRSIHSLARRVVLSSARLFTQFQLVKACNFMLDDPDHCACWLCELYVQPYALADLKDGHTAEAVSALVQLAGLLEAAQNIQTLSLPYMEVLVVAEPRIGTALISLTRLQDVELLGVSSHVLDVANQMVSRPSRVSLGFVSPLAGISEHIVQLSHLTLLENARRVNIVFSDADDADEFKQPSDFDFELAQLGQYPSVRELCLYLCGPLPIFHIFPNMQILRMRRLNASFRRFDWRTWAWTGSVPLIKADAPNNDNRVQRTPYRMGRLPTGPLPDMLTSWVESLLPVIRQSRLVCMKLRFDVGNPPLKVTGLNAVREMLARQLQVPSLRYICIDAGWHQLERGPFDSHDYQRLFLVTKCTWCQVRDVGGERCVGIISCKAGERVERYLCSAEFEKTLSLDGVVLT